ncbi:MAG: alanine racemase [Christensenellales bacterium]|jgi:alanine racemase
MAKELVIERADLAHNVRALTAHSRGAALMAVVKGDGYGLGLLPLTRELIALGIERFAVADAAEAFALRAGGVQAPLLLLTPAADAAEAAALIAADVALTVGSAEQIAQALSAEAACGRAAQLHLKIDTGFGRYGLLPGELPEAIGALAGHPLSGVYTHFSSSFDRDERITREAFAAFQGALAQLAAAGIDPGTRHCCNSCAFVRFPEMHLDMVRVGSAILGRLPIANTLGLKRLGYLQCPILQTRTLPKGSRPGYSRVTQLKADTPVAVIPVGYKDGFLIQKGPDCFRPLDVARYIFGDLKRLGAHLTVSIGGKPCRVLGKVGMYHTLADLTGCPAKAGEAARFAVNPLMVDSRIPRIYR